MIRATLSLSLAFWLSACSLTPPLERPAPPIPASYAAQEPGQSASAAPSVPSLDRNALFLDPRLRQLIDWALASNRDLRLTMLNVQAVQAQYRIQRADLLPSVSADATSSRERTRVATGGGPATPEVSKRVGLSVGISAFELDVFGRVQALSDAALARYFASEHGYQAAQIALVGAVADAYFAQRLAQEQLELSEQTLADWEQSLALALLMKQAQQSSGLDVAEAEGQVATAQADVEARRRSLDQAGNALQLLVGVELPADLPPPLPLAAQSAYQQLPAGLPSDLLLTRPDLQQAEQWLIAANADIGAARAAFFPRISLTASLGYASPSLGGLFDASRQVWSFAPQITQPLFQYGRLRGELRLAEVRQSEAVTQYERTIQVAFREVADALAGTATFGRQIDAQQRAVASAERRSELSNLRYRAGLQGRFELLDAQRQLYAQRQTLLDLHSAAVSNVVALYKALGGGRVAGEPTPGPSGDIR